MNKDSIFYNITLSLELEGFVVNLRIKIRIILNWKYELIMSLNAKLLIVLPFLAILAGCQTFAATDSVAEKNFFKSNSLSSLADLGDSNGELIVAVVNNQDAIPRPKLPRVEPLPENFSDTDTLTLGSFIKRSGIAKSRINPAMEFGAIYYLPKKYNIDVGNNGKIIQKLCATVDDHDLDNVIIDDVFSGIKQERRKLVLNGSVDAKLIKGLAGIEASANANYLFDFKVENVRLRSINGPDAKAMQERLIAGHKCRTVYFPQAKGRQKFQLIAAYYGTLTLKQAYAIKANVATPQLSTELEIKGEDESNRFLFFKIYKLEI